MLKYVAFAVLTGAAVITMGYAQSAAPQAKPPVVTIHAPKTAPSDGKQMFVSYCAPCHGVDGRGQGPVSSALVVKPADLSLLAKNNNGKYPGEHVDSVIEFGSTMPAHGSQDMPVWGPVFGRMDRKGLNTQEYTLRIRNLETYIKSLQAN